MLKFFSSKKKTLSPVEDAATSAMLTGEHQIPVLEVEADQLNTQNQIAAEPELVELSTSSAANALTHDKELSAGGEQIDARRQRRFFRDKKESSPKTPVVKAVPIRILIGYLPNASERDALEYTLGLVYKHFTQIGISYYEVFPYKDGFAYEAHEGGSGSAYLPSIIHHFEAQGPFNSAESFSVIVASSHRLVQVQRTRDGLEAVWLPEGSNFKATEEIVASEDMRPVINKRTGYLVAGATLFLTGFIAMIVSGIVFRIQPYDVPTPKNVALSYSQLPIGQYKQVISNFSSTSQRIIKVEYKNGSWQSPEVEKVQVSTPAPAPTPLPLNNGASSSLAEASGAAPSTPITSSVPTASAPLILPPNQGATP